MLELYRWQTLLTTCTTLPWQYRGVRLWATTLASAHDYPDRSMTGWMSPLMTAESVHFDCCSIRN